MIESSTSCPALQASGVGWRDAQGWIEVHAWRTNDDLAECLCADLWVRRAIRAGDPEADQIVRFVATRFLRDLSYRANAEKLTRLWRLFMAASRVTAKTRQSARRFWLRRAASFDRTLAPRALPLERWRIWLPRLKGRPRRVLELIGFCAMLNRVGRQERQYGELLLEIAEEFDAASLPTSDRDALSPIRSACRSVAAPLIGSSSDSVGRGSLGIVVQHQDCQSGSGIAGRLVRFGYRRSDSPSLQRPEAFGQDFLESIRIREWRNDRGQAVDLWHDLDNLAPTCAGKSGSLAFGVARVLFGRRPSASLPEWLAITGSDDCTAVYGLDAKRLACVHDGIRLLVIARPSHKDRIDGVAVNHVRTITVSTGASQPECWIAELLASTSTLRPIEPSSTGAALRGRWRPLVLAVGVFACALAFSGLGRRPIVPPEFTVTPSSRVADVRLDALRQQAAAEIRGFEQRKVEPPVGPPRESWRTLRAPAEPDQTEVSLIAERFEHFRILEKSVTWDLRAWVPIGDRWETASNGALNRIVKADRVRTEPVQPAFFHSYYKLKCVKAPVGLSDAWLALSFETGGWGVSGVAAFAVLTSKEVPLPLTLLAGENSQVAIGSPGDVLTRTIAKIDLSQLSLTRDQVIELRVEGIYWNGLNDVEALGKPFDWVGTRLEGPAEEANLSVLFSASVPRLVESFIRGPADDNPILMEQKTSLWGIFAGNRHQYTLEPGLQRAKSRHPSSIIGIRYRNATGIDLLKPVVSALGLLTLVACVVIAGVPWRLLVLSRERASTEVFRPTQALK